MTNIAEVTDNVVGVDEPAILFAVTEMVPALSFANTVNVIAPCPESIFHPEGTDQVYVSAPTTAGIVYAITCPELGYSLPDIADGELGGDMFEDSNILKKLGKTQLKLAQKRSRSTSKESKG